MKGEQEESASIFIMPRGYNHGRHPGATGYGYKHKKNRNHRQHSRHTLQALSCWVKADHGKEQWVNSPQSTLFFSSFSPSTVHLDFWTLCLNKSEGLSNPLPGLEAVGGAPLLEEVKKIMRTTSYQTIHPGALYSNQLGSSWSQFHHCRVETIAID